MLQVPKVLLLDGDGVIWLDKIPIKGSIESLNLIRSFGVRLILVTNNCSKTRRQYLSFMENMGLKGFTIEDIYSSGYVTALYLLKNGIKDVYVCGFPGLMEELRLNGINVYNIENKDKIRKVDALVVSKCDSATFEEIKSAMNVAEKFNCPLIGTNPDPNFPMSHGVLIPGSGAIVNIFENALGKKATLIGKPESPMFDAVLENLKISKEDVMMVGDRLITDIAFAANQKARSVLVLSGVDTKDMVDKVTDDKKPTFVLKSLVEVADLIKEMTNRDNKVFN